MLYNEYGSTGKTVSAVGFGGMRFDLQRSQEENAELILYAVEKGITFLDTAPGYCQDQSEVIFGKALQQLPREKVYICTKANPEFVDTAEKAVEQVHKSLERLHVDKIDFFYVWCLRQMSHYDKAMCAGGEYEGLLRCKEEGLIDRIVFSSHQSGPEIKTILESRHFDGVLLGCNILNFPYRWDGVQSAHEMGYGVAAMNPLAGGQIPQHIEELAFLASEGETPTEAALRFLLGCPEVTVALVGFTTREQIDTACRVAKDCTPFSTAERERIGARLGENMNEICTGCGYCVDCPAGINIPAFMQIFNDRVMFGKSEDDMRKAMQFQYTWGMLSGQEGKLGSCVECGRCENACTQHLPLIARLGELLRWEEEGRAEKQ